MSRKKVGELDEIIARIKRQKYSVSIGDNLHESFYDADGTLKSSLYIRSQRMGSRGEGRSYPVIKTNLK